MSTNSYSKNITNWIYDDIKLYASSNKSKHEDAEYYLYNNLKFITYNFDIPKLNLKYASSYESISIGSVEMVQFNHFYNMVCRSILGPNYNKKPPNEKPLSIVCLDANGSRYWKEMGELSNIHLHSIWVMKPDTVDHLMSIREKALKMDQAFDFKQIDVRGYKPENFKEDSLKTLISYTMKFDRFNQKTADISDTFMKYPKNP